MWTLIDNVKYLGILIEACSLLLVQCLKGLLLLKIGLLFGDTEIKQCGWNVRWQIAFQFYENTFHNLN